MKKTTLTVICLLLTAAISPQSWAQDTNKEAAEERARRLDPGSSVKVQIIFSEYEGEKKVKSVPYTLSLKALRSPDAFNPWTKLRIGNRVPATTGNGQSTYLDVGTSIDSRAIRTDDGRYSLQLNIERSSIDGAPGQSKDPVVQQFKSELNLIVREAETVESAFATDPMTGKVTKVQVTLTAVK